jgi:peptidoglycan DL-endopeptidase RipA
MCRRWPARSRSWRSNANRRSATSRNLTAHLQQLQAELTELRQRPPQVDRATFRDLGPMVDRILALAQMQAEAIVDTAAQRAAEHQAEAERVLGETREQADKLRADGEAAQERAEQEAKRINET